MRTTHSILGLIDYGQPRSRNDQDASAHPQQRDETHPDSETGEPKVQPGLLDPPAVTLPTPPARAVASMVKGASVTTDPLDIFPSETPQD